MQSTVKCLKSHSDFSLVSTCSAILSRILCLTLPYSFVNNLKKKHFRNQNLHDSILSVFVDTLPIIPSPSLSTSLLQHILQGKIKLLLPTLPPPTIYVPFFPLSAFGCNISTFLQSHSTSPKYYEVLSNWNHLGDAMQYTQMNVQS